MDTVLILDFGSQTTQLIGRRVRELGVYSRILPGETALAPLLGPQVRGIILSGSPYSVCAPGSPRPDAAVYSSGRPILGICYGLQRIIQDHGGEVTSVEKREYGRSRIHFSGKRKPALFAGVPEGFISWMSHGDTITKAAPGFSVGAVSENGLPAFLQHPEKRIYGIQFHPEVTHCEGGLRILENFLFKICGVQKGWSMEAYLERIAGEIRVRVGAAPVLLLTSGGVDSTVVAAVLLKLLDPDRVHLLYIDTGLMRLKESEEVQQRLEGLGARHLHEIDASARFFAALKGVIDPEEKRQAIGDLFIRVQAEEIAKLGIPGAFLAQGTLYTDLIESGKGVGAKANVIKSHHNVRSPLVEEKRAMGLLIEPLAELYKDEVRELGRRLGLGEETVGRQPFPGPGLAVRILGEVTAEKCDLLRRADSLYLSELRRRGHYDRIWQAFSVLLPLRSVGVSGDVRRYGYVLALRAITSKDGMTADVYPFPVSELLEISAGITNSIPEIGRVVYDISSKPPATIEWE